MTKDQLKLLSRMCVSWNGSEFGAPCIDAKRPYGNSYVYDDIAEILGEQIDPESGPTGEQRERYEALHESTELALQELLDSLADEDVISVLLYKTA